MSLQMNKGTIFAEVILRSRIHPDPHKLCSLIETKPPTNKKDIQ